MHNFLTTLFALILGFYSQRGTPVDDTQKERLQGVTNDIWQVTDSEKKPFTGEAAHEASALVLASIAAHESGFWEKVQDCSACQIGGVYCDKGRSIALYQLHVGSGTWKGYTRNEICESNNLASSLAWDVVMRNRKANTPLALFKGYATGGRRKAAPEMETIFNTFANKANIIVTYKNGSMLATFKKKAAPPTLLPQPVAENTSLLK